MVVAQTKEVAEVVVVLGVVDRLLRVVLGGEKMQKSNKTETDHR